MLPTRFWSSYQDPRANQMAKGLRALGYTVKACSGMCDPTSGDDVLIMWGKSKHRNEPAADKFEKAGGRVIVAEESHLKEVVEGKIFSLSLHDHNGAGHFPTWGGQRLKDLRLRFEPWKEDGEHILVCGQRGMGSKLMHSPADWHHRAAEQIKRKTDRPVLIRVHPKSRLPADQPFLATQATLQNDLASAWAVVIWASGVGCQALLDGYPVVYGAPRYFLEKCCTTVEGTDWESPRRLPREPAFEEFVWSQWKASEIESGEAFARLLSRRP